MNRRWHLNVGEYSAGGWRFDEAGELHPPEGAGQTMVAEQHGTDELDRWRDFAFRSVRRTGWTHEEATAATDQQMRDRMERAALVGRAACEAVAEEGVEAVMESKSDYQRAAAMAGGSRLEGHVRRLTAPYGDGRVMMFPCRAGMVRDEQRVAALVRAIKYGLWGNRVDVSTADSDARPHVISIALYESSIRVQTRGPLSAQDRSLIDQACAEFDAGEVATIAT